MLKLLLWVLLLIPAIGLATTYTNGINESGWSSDSSVFECRLDHTVPYYGKAVFSTRAGESSKFYLKARSSRFNAGKAEVLVKAPLWKGQGDNMSLGMVDVKRGLRPMWLGSKNAEKMLSELNAGSEIEFVRDAWYEPKESLPMRLAISNIGFREEYRRYLLCLGGLLPANFDQLKRTALYFRPGIPEESDGLEKSITRKLDQVLLLVKHDSNIRKFYIDGHASAPGDRSDNLELSKRRAELTAEYLKLRGIPEDQLVVRWHGERYPVASNATVSGRAKNRRVTLRLEKVKEFEKTMAANNAQ